MEFKDIYVLILLIIFIPVPIGAIWFYCYELRSNQNIIEPQNDDVQNDNDDVVIHINENVQNNTI